MLQERERKKKELNEKKKQKKVEALSNKNNQKRTTPGAVGVAGALGPGGLPLAYHPALLQGMMQYPHNMMMGN